MAHAKSKSNGVDGQDAITRLKEDHDRLRELFQDFDKLTQGNDKDPSRVDLVKRICQEFMLHAQLEEEIFYPAVRKAIDDDDMMNEAEVEHASAQELIIQLEAMKPDDGFYNAKVVVLGEMIEHHAKEEEDEMFIKAKKSKLDIAALGEELARRKQKLAAELT
jgi:DUF438 domain-containing protein